MTDPQTPRRSRRTVAILVGLLVLVIAAVTVTVIGFVASGRSVPQPTKVGASASTSPSSIASSSPAATSSPAPRATRSTPAPTAPTPQTTRTTAISSAAPIVKSLTARVSKTESVKGTATGPGEIAGPSLRFTVQISNRTGKRVALANTVVNVYSGKGQIPAVELSGPGAKDFPAAVADGATATGVFVFNVPKDDRSSITVTVDTSTSNPVIAFQGATP